MKNIKWLNDLKIRLSYGEVGNQSGIDRYDGCLLYTSLFSSCYIQNHLYICIVIKTEKDSIMETTANTYDDIITR